MKQSRRGFLGALFASPLAGPVGKLAALLPAAPVVTSYWQVGLREELMDMIYTISPTDTPFLSVMRAQGHTPTIEWQNDELV